MKWPIMIMAGGAMLGCGGCAASSTTDGGAEPAAPPMAQCSNDGLDRFVGQKATAELGAEMLKFSGARTLRWGGPNTAMTMDFRPDRLTVIYDQNMVIERLSCG